MANKNSPPDPMRAEIGRLRQILWDIAKMTGFEGPEEAPEPGDMDVDVPEIAMDSVKQHCADYLSYTGPQGRDVNPEAGPDDRCTCGQTITWLHGAWFHLYNERLHGRAHGASPATGYYEPVPQSIVPIPAQREAVVPPEPPEYARGGMVQPDLDAESIRRLGRLLEEAHVRVDDDAMPTVDRYRAARTMPEHTYTWTSPTTGIPMPVAELYEYRQAEQTEQTIEANRPARRGPELRRRPRRTIEIDETPADEEGPF